MELVTSRFANTLYDGLRPAVLLNALGSELKKLAFVRAPDVDARTRGRLLGALSEMGLEVLDMRLEGKSDKCKLSLSLVSLFVPKHGAKCDVLCVRLRCNPVYVGGYVTAQHTSMSHSLTGR